MIKIRERTFLILVIVALFFSCSQKPSNKDDMQSNKMKTAEEILGNPKYRAISYGGYREKSRDIQPTVEELKEDMRILSAMGIGMLRTYNVQLAHASNVLKAIKELKKEDSSFEMYVMLGAWIDCKNAWTELPPDHTQESEQNEEEIARVVELAKQYPDIVKVIAVGNEAMVKWAAAYFVQPEVILKWVNHLQDLKKKGDLPKDLWITSSDNFASWGGGGPEYHVEDLHKLIEAVDFISLHTYPMHDTHYNPRFWGVLKKEDSLSKEQKLQKIMERSRDYAIMQYNSVKKYVKSLGLDKPMHIGETGWASLDSENHHYGITGSQACDEHKQGLYHQLMREWTESQGISCFYFEAFDEKWKDSQSPKGSENHFGLFTIDGQAKYAIWPLVDKGVFEGLKRNGNKITKTYGGNGDELLKTVNLPDTKIKLEIAH